MTLIGLKWHTCTTLTYMDFYDIPVLLWHTITTLTNLYYFDMPELSTLTYLNYFDIPELLWHTWTTLTYLYYFDIGTCTSLTYLCYFDILVLLRHTCTSLTYLNYFDIFISNFVNIGNTTCTFIWYFRVHNSLCLRERERVSSGLHIIVLKILLMGWSKQQPNHRGMSIRWQEFSFSPTSFLVTHRRS